MPFCLLCHENAHNTCSFYCVIYFAAQHEETYLLRCALNSVPNQPTHLRFPFKVFVVHMKKFCILCYAKCAQGRIWSDCANAQADLNLRSAQLSDGLLRFLTLRIICFVFWFLQLPSWSESSLDHITEDVYETANDYSIFFQDIAYVLPGELFATRGF